MQNNQNGNDNPVPAKTGFGFDEASEKVCAGATANAAEDVLLGETVLVGTALSDPAVGFSSEATIVGIADSAETEPWTGSTWKIVLSTTLAGERFAISLGAGKENGKRSLIGTSRNSQTPTWGATRFRIKNQMVAKIKSKANDSSEETKAH